METRSLVMALLALAMPGWAGPPPSEKPCDLNEVDDPGLRQRLQALPQPAACRAWERLRVLQVPVQDYSHIEIDPQGGVRYVDPAPPALPPAPREPALP